HRLEHLAIEIDDALLALEHHARELAAHIVGVVLTEAFEIRIAEGARVVEKRLPLRRAAAEPRHPRRQRRDRYADLRVPPPSLELRHLAIAEVIDREELHRRVFALLQRTEGEIGPVLRREEVHVDFSKDVALVAHHELRANELADAIVRPVQELE